MASPTLRRFTQLIFELPPIVLTPDPVVISLDLPAALILSELTLCPEPVVLVLELPAFGLESTLTLTPGPVSLVLELPEALVEALLTLTPAPVVLRLELPAAVLRRRGRAVVRDVRLVAGGEGRFYGELSRATD